MSYQYCVVGEDTFPLNSPAQRLEAEAAVFLANLEFAESYVVPADDDFDGDPDEVEDFYANGVKTSDHVYPAELTEKVKTLAQAAAQEFVDEFHEPLDSGKTDWDAECWSQGTEEQALLAPYRDCSKWCQEQLYSHLWEIYREALESESERIAGTPIPHKIMGFDIQLSPVQAKRWNEGEMSENEMATITLEMPATWRGLPASEESTLLEQSEFFEGEFAVVDADLKIVEVK